MKVPPAHIIAKIDAAILAVAEKKFRKVAYIVGKVMDSISDTPKNIPDTYYTERVAYLVETGQLEAQGNPQKMRFSEVRIPSLPLSKEELQQMIDKAEYGTLGNIYESGQGVPKDYEEALKWYEKAADQGEIWSQMALGRFYMNGYGVKPDWEQACFWFCLFDRNSGNKYPLASEDAHKIIAGNLTREQIAELKQRAEEWKPNKYSHD